MTILRKSLFSTLGSLALALALSGVAVAQDNTPTNGMDKMGKMGAMHSAMKGMHGNMMGMHMMPATVTEADAKTGLALLAPDVTISEDNVVQTRDAYANGHLGEDLAFLKDAKITPVSLGSMLIGDTAMVGSESELRTTIKGKPLSLRSREMLDLKKFGNSWKIVTIHWQSTPLTEKGS
jgi:hypothetical protein